MNQSGLESSMQPGMQSSPSSALPSPASSSSCPPQSVGIDVAKAKIDVAIAWGMGEKKIKQFGNQSQKDMEKLVSWLKINGVQGSTPIVLESTASYHWLSCLLLCEAGFQVHLINPLLTKRYEKYPYEGLRQTPSMPKDWLRLES